MNFTIRIFSPEVRLKRMERYINKIIHSDCLEVMKEMPENSVDLICTDPPYGYSFMGKDWDKAVPSVEVWQECLRVLKPGGFAFVMSAPRSDVCSRMCLRLEEAGFVISFTPIYWTYASGFPKAMNIGKMVDKRNGQTIRTGKGLNVVGNDGLVPLSVRDGGEKFVAKSEEAKALEGSYGGFQPKPAVEVIIVAMKPLSEKTYVDQALKNGKGITWLDDCRVPTSEPVQSQTGHKGQPFGTHKHPFTPREYTTQGRFPADLLVSDDVLNDGKNHHGAGNYVRADDSKSEYFGLKRPVGYTQQPSDKGSYSRYFSLDAWASTLPFLIVPKASKSEKNRGLSENNIDNSDKYDGKFPNSKADKNKNVHPTVKPLKLMSYLITLGSRPGDTILDPFSGSCTTLVAAKELKRNYIGIERENEYVSICEARLEAVPSTLF